MKNRTTLVPAALAAAMVSFALPAWSAPADLAAIEAQVAKQHDAGVARLQAWIRLPSIAAEDRGFPEGPEHLIALLKSVGFQHTEIVETDGKPGVFATLDAGASRTLGVYMMYDVNFSGGYDPTSTPANAELIQAQIAVLKASGIDPILWPRNAGSYPGYVFTGPPLRLASGHFGLGHGSGAHAPDEYFVIESSNPNVEGWNGAVMSYVRYLYELAK